MVLLLHGLVSDATTWQPAITPLAERGLRVIALDLLGHGESDQPALRYTLEDFADSISAFLAALELPAATVVGHSLGGAIAMQFAHHYRSQIARLVLVSSGGLGKQVHLVLRGATSGRWCCHPDRCESADGALVSAIAPASRAADCSPRR